MDIKETKKTVRVYSDGDEIVEVEKEEKVTEFWYTRRGYGRKIFVFGLLGKITPGDYLESVFKNGSALWNAKGIV